MKPSVRKYLELFVMVFLACVFYVFYPQIEGVSLFALGFIWNWSTSIELDPSLNPRGYRFSMFKTAINFQKLLMKPFLKTPSLVQRVLRILPAGLFWSGVIFINDSNMPWWSTFIGSFSFEIFQFEMDFIKNHKKTL